MIDAAILLAAGEGSRLRPVEPYKPLCRVGGAALIDHALEGLAAAGVARACVVLGYGAAAVAAHLAARRWPLAVETVTLEDWSAPNGVSALAGARRLAGPALLAPTLLAMCDHLVDPGLYRLLVEAGAGDGARLGVDRRLGAPAVDLDDVTRVRTSGGRIVAIGKGLAEYDAFDTGVFAINARFAAALAASERPSVSAAMTALAARGQASVAETGDLGWIDVDDAAALAAAEAWLADRRARALHAAR